MKRLFHKIYSSIREYSEENLLLQIEKQIIKLHPKILEGDYLSARKVFELMSLQDKLKAE